MHFFVVTLNNISHTGNSLKKHYLLAGVAMMAILAMPAASSQDDTGSMLKKKARLTRDMQIKQLIANTAPDNANGKGYEPSPFIWGADRAPLPMRFIDASLHEKQQTVKMQTAGRKQ